MTVRQGLRSFFELRPVSSLLTACFFGSLLFLLSIGAVISPNWSMPAKERCIILVGFFAQVCGVVVLFYHGYHFVALVAAYLLVGLPFGYVIGPAWLKGDEAISPRKSF